MSLQVPKSLKGGHESIYATLKRAMREPGATGEAARSVMRVMDGHMLREEKFALRPLGILKALGRGETPADLAEAASLALQMGPGTHQAAALVGQMGQFDLQRTLFGPRATPEDFENEPSAVEHLGAPGLFQVALLYRRQCAIDHHDAGVETFHEARNLVDLALTDIGRGPDVVNRHDADFDNVEIDRTRQSDHLFEAGGGNAIVVR